MNYAFLSSIRIRSPMCVLQIKAGSGSKCLVQPGFIYISTHNFLLLTFLLFSVFISFLHGSRNESSCLNGLTVSVGIITAGGASQTDRMQT